MLTLAPDTPRWVTLYPATGGGPEVAVEFAPIDIRAVRVARRALGLALDVDRDDLENAGDAMSRELIRRGIRRWRGVNGPDGTPAEPTDTFPVLDEDGAPVLDADGEPVVRTAVDLFVVEPRAFEAADRLYVLPWLVRDREGNVSSASPSGIGEAAMPVPDIAAMPATGGPTGDADQTPTAPAAARTSSTRRRRKKG